jgi:hypothetical protein
MTEDLILMERLETRANKDVFVIKVCLGFCLGFGLKAGVDVPEAIEAIAASLVHSNSADVTTVCGSCSIQ